MVHVVSVVFAAACTAVYELAWYWPYPAHDLALWIPFIPALGIPTLLITGMGFGVLWNKLLPPRNARYRSLSLFFARLLASTYLMAIRSVLKLLKTYLMAIRSVLKLLKMYYPIDKTFNTVMHVFGIFFLLGAFQVCLALTMYGMLLLICGAAENMIMGFCPTPPLAPLGRLCKNLTITMTTTMMRWDLILSTMQHPQ